MPRDEELRELFTQSALKWSRGAVEKPNSSSSSEVEMEKVELPVRGVALRDLLRQRMGSDVSPSPPSSGNEGAVVELRDTSGTGSEVDMEKVGLPVRGAALRELVCEHMASISSPSPPSSLEEGAAPGIGKHLGVRVCSK